jgi:hypothetical protein
VRAAGHGLIVGWLAERMVVLPERERLLLILRDSLVG